MLPSFTYRLENAMTLNVFVITIIALASRALPWCTLCCTKTTGRDAASITSPSSCFYVRCPGFPFFCAPGSPPDRQVTDVPSWNPFRPFRSD